jgi:hypothetical protein
VYFPSTSPHATRSDPEWTSDGNGVSVSIGVVFYTDQTRRDAHVRAWNLFLRKFGLKPRQPGGSPAIDRMKASCGRALVWAWKTFRGFRPKKGF